MPIRELFTNDLHLNHITSPNTDALDAFSKQLKNNYDLNLEGFKFGQYPIIIKVVMAHDYDETNC